MKDRASALLAVATFFAAAPLAAQQEGVVRSTTAITATVVAIDAERRVVRLQGPERTVELPVAADVDLRAVAIGDRVGAVFEESLAIVVEPVQGAD